MPRKEFFAKRSSAFDYKIDQKQGSNTQNTTGISTILFTEDQVCLYKFWGRRDLCFISPIVCKSGKILLPTSVTRKTIQLPIGIFFTDWRDNVCGGSANIFPVFAFSNCVLRNVVCLCRNGKLEFKISCSCLCGCLIYLSFFCGTTYQCYYHEGPRWIIRV